MVAVWVCVGAVGALAVFAVSITIVDILKEHKHAKYQ
jgi:hypothetical protein